MAKFRIARLAGDGIGKDVMEAGLIVLDEIGLDAEYIDGDIGWQCWVNEGDPLPPRTIELLKNTDCCLFGAITSKDREAAERELKDELRGKGLSYFSPIVRMRQEFNLRTCLRPCRAYKGNPLNYREDIDIVVFRENTEGLYAGIEFFPMPQELVDTLLKTNSKMKRFANVPLNEMAFSSRLMTKKASENIIRDAFEYAQKQGRRSVTIVDKPNVLRETGGLFMRTAREVHKDYPAIEMGETNIDAMCMWLIKNPQNYSVLVAENMFGDIISDLCAQLVGGMGFASSANIGDSYAVFEPTHGSAPKYAGQYKVNPMAMLLTIKLMLEYLKEHDSAAKIESAIAEVIVEGKVKTYDMGGSNTSLEVAKEVARKIRNRATV